MGWTLVARRGRRQLGLAVLPTGSLLNLFSPRCPQLGSRHRLADLVHQAPHLLSDGEVPLSARVCRSVLKLERHPQEVRKRFQRQSVETMNLYKAHGCRRLAAACRASFRCRFGSPLIRPSITRLSGAVLAHIHDLTAAIPLQRHSRGRRADVLQMRMSPSGRTANSRRRCR